MKIVSIIVSLFAAVAFANPAATTAPATTTEHKEVAATSTPAHAEKKEEAKTAEKKLHKKVKASGEKKEEVKTETK